VQAGAGLEAELAPCCSRASRRQRERPPTGSSNSCDRINSTAGCLIAADEIAQWAGEYALAALENKLP
jgi:hypothetical protein